jgi:hypothetical protein
LIDIQVAYVVLYSGIDGSFKKEENMKKTFCFVAFVLFFLGISLQAMDQATTTTTPTVAPIANACRWSFIKTAFIKSLSWCKAHPIYFAAGISIAALTTVYLTCPTIKAKIREYLGLETSDDDIKFGQCCFCRQNNIMFDLDKNCDQELNPLCEL